jgi:hypothetical protein
MVCEFCHPPANGKRVPLEKENNADLSTPLPRISCRTWWRWCTSCAFPLQKGAHADLSSAAWQEIRVRSGRDDNSSWKRYSASPNRIVISTGPRFPATHRWTKPCVLLSLRKAAWSTPTPLSSTGNPGERSVVERSALFCFSASRTDPRDWW